MNKDFLIGYLIGAGIALTLGIFIDKHHTAKFEKQIQQRDSVNTHNAIVIELLHEYIRLDSLTQLEQLYPKK